MNRFLRRVKRFPGVSLFFFFLFFGSVVDAGVPASPHFSAGNRGGPPVTYFVGNKGWGIVLSSEGRILGIRWKGQVVQQPLSAFAEIRGTHQTGKTIVRKDKEGALVFERTFVNDIPDDTARNRAAGISGNTPKTASKRSCILTERFTSAGGSIRWEQEIRRRGPSWGGEINTEFDYPVTDQTRFWTSWGSPPGDSLLTDRQLAEGLRPIPGGSGAGSFMGDGNNQWVDPLLAVPFTDTVFFYGLPYFTYEHPRIAVCPFQGNLFCIPMCSILEPAKDQGVTFALSPEDDLIDLVMHTGRGGRVCFSRLFNRISAGRPLHFAVDIVVHAADWRAGLGWMAARYPGYFQPKNKGSRELAGTGAYAGPFEVIENGKMREMDFTTNWQSSFDFPYMGMFLPPVKRDQPWKRFGDSMISIDGMEAYARRMKKAGFHVLNYFNVTEFGARVKYPAPPGTPGTAGLEKDEWKGCNTFLYPRLPRAILPTPLAMKPQQGNESGPGGPFYTWEGGIVMDCGDPAYRDFLLDQAGRHIRDIPDAGGICIDRMDWLRMFNERADDGKTWFEGRPVRSLVHSFEGLMDTLGPLLHGPGRVYSSTTTTSESISLRTRTAFSMSSPTRALPSISARCFVWRNRHWAGRMPPRPSKRKAPITSSRNICIWVSSRCARILPTTIPFCRTAWSTGTISTIRRCYSGCAGGNGC
ncbi:MAG: hypothetical protein P4L51_02970 [Puia sp.]|nr:hypothetical protein [Puia sp.]